MKKLTVIVPVSLVATLCLVAVASATHPRHGFGSPYVFPLAPAFKQCTTPNATHVPPYSLNGCAPPQPESSLLTTGATGAASGSVRIDVICNVAAGATTGSTLPCSDVSGDQEDIRIAASLSDVRCVGPTIPGCSAAGADFTGQVLLHQVLRATDHSSRVPPPGALCPNGAGSDPCVTATVEDFHHDTPIQCVDNGGSNGANCNVATTFDSMLANSVSEGQRLSIEVIGAIEVLDPGPDGTVVPPPPSFCGPICGTGDEQVYQAANYFAP